jgi:5'-nucleotidase
MSPDMHLKTSFLAAGSLAALVSLVSCSIPATAPSPTASEPIHVVLAATTDHHGWVEGHQEKVNAAPELRFRSGGLDVLGGYLKNLREAHPGRVVLLDAGDIFQGTLPSNLFEGKPVVEAYNLLGYQAAAIGNHEFDYGPEGERSVPREPGDDPFGALKRNMAIANFPFLSANIFDRNSGKRPDWVKPWTVIEAAGARIGVIGVITIDTPTVTAPANVESLNFIDPTEAILQVLPELERERVDAVVVAAHLGGFCTDVSDPRDPSKCAPESDIFRMARDLPPGKVDVIFSGHTHNQIRHYVNGIAISEAPALGRGLSVIDLWIDRGAGTRRTEIRPHVNICEKVFLGTEICNPRALTPDTPLQLVNRSFGGKMVEPDGRIVEKLSPYVAQVQAKKREPLGITVSGTFSGNYYTESTLGDLIADAMRASVPDADFAIMNSGGLRSELRGPTVTFGDLFEVLPFDNYLAVVRLSGRELREVIRLGASGRQGIMQVSGLKVVLDPTKDEALPAENRDRVISILREDGSPLDPNATYVVVMNDFLAAGGDGLAPVMRLVDKERIQLTSHLLRDVVTARLRDQSKAAPLMPRLDGRITAVVAESKGGDGTKKPAM